MIHSYFAAYLHSWMFTSQAKFALKNLETVANKLRTVFKYHGTEGYVEVGAFH